MGVAFERVLEEARKLSREEITLLIRRLEAEAWDGAAAESFARAAGRWGDVDVDSFLREIYSARKRRGRARVTW
ncbi:MAG: hypothetical protein H5U04_05460 [Firmicutes bacterium]|nr:hypothetical protein [Bacillota bacterium]